ncbi:hypothetical protein N2152v2_010668 [Parachlorella kessleri]
MVPLDQLLNAQRRAWLICAVLALTVLMSWSSIHRLQELVEAEDADEAPDNQQSLFSLAEKNVLEHLPQRRAGLHRGSLPGEQNLVQGAPADTVQPQGGAGAGGDGSRAAGGSAAGRGGVAQSAQQQSEEVLSTTGGGQCRVVRNMDYWGDALVWGENNRMDTAGDCCKACAEYKPKQEQEMLSCNIWVYCENPQLCGGHHKECWLKHMAHPEASRPAHEGPNVGWTTGFMVSPEDAKQLPVDPSDDRRYHIVITAQGSAVHWQSRVAFYWYKKTKALCETQGSCQMGGFTRLLHSGQADELMGEIPTVVVNPLPPEHPNHGYVVLNRPYAFLQWVSQAAIPEKYVLMSEPDHIWLKPMPNLMKGQRPAAFPFFYIEPWTKVNLPITARFLGPLSRMEAEQIAPIGNAPTLMTLEDMKRVMPIWFNLSIAVHNDPVSNKEWGWVQEMYAFTLSCTKAGISKIDLHLYVSAQPGRVLLMMGQPPFDSKLDLYYILHYTYGNDFNMDGAFTPGKIGEWHWDKRAYHALPPPRHMEEPPPTVKNELVRHLVRSINEATDKIPGWDEYAKTGHAAQLWDGVL